MDDSALPSARVPDLRTIVGAIEGADGEAGRADSPSGPVLAVVGARGSGRSWLLRSADRLSSARTVIVPVSPAEAAWPLSGLSAVLVAIDGELGTDLIDLLGDLAPPEPDGEPGESGSLAAAAARGDATGADDAIGPDAGEHLWAFALARRLAAAFRSVPGAPLCVLVDDADAMDEPSRLVLGFVLRRLADSGLRFVVSAAPLTDVSPFVGIPTLTVSSLDVRTLIEIGRSFAGPGADDAVLEVVARTSAGNPATLRGYLDALPRDVLHGTAPLRFPLDPGPSRVAAVAPLLDGLTEAEAEVLRYASCSPAAPQDVSEQLGQDLRTGLQQLIARGLVIRRASAIAVADPVVRYAAYTSMPPVEHLALHSRLAEAALPDYPGLHAWHRSFTRLDPVDAVDLIESACERAAAGEVATAIEVAERALALSSGPELADGITELARLLTMSGRLGYARRYHDFAAELEAGRPHPPALAELRILLDFAESRPLPRQQIRATLAAHAADRPAECARLICLAGAALATQHDTDAARPAFAEAAELDGGSPFVGALARIGDALIAALHGRDTIPDDAFADELAALDDVHDRSLATLVVAQALMFAERHSEADGLLAPLVESGPPSAGLWTGLGLHVRLRNSQRAGRFHLARALHDVIVARADALTVIPAPTRTLSASQALADGEPDDADEHLAAAAALVPTGSQPVLEARISSLRGLSALLRGEPAVAARHYARARARSGEIGNPLLLRFHYEYLHILITLGERTRANEVAAELEELHARMPSAWSERALQCARPLLLSGEESLAAFDELLAHWPAGDGEFLRFQTVIALALRLERLGRPVAAERALHEAIALLQSLGIREVVADRLTAAYRRAPRTIEDPLGDRELQIVERVQKGLKNQAIARELFVSVRTVELRLTSIYRKVGVRSRFELVRWMAARLATDA